MHYFMLTVYMVVFVATTWSLACNESVYIYLVINFPQFVPSPTILSRAHDDIIIVMMTSCTLDTIFTAV